MKQKMNSTISLMLGALIVVAGIGTVSSDAEARRHRRGHPGRMARGGGGLMPDAVKAQLKLSDEQSRRIDAIRTNYQKKRIDLRARMARLRLRHQQLMKQDLPPEKAVLESVRKRRHLRGLIAEERVKARLKIRTVLTPQQRQQLRQIRLQPFGKGRFHKRRGWKPGRFSSTADRKPAKS